LPRREWNFCGDMVFCPPEIEWQEATMAKPSATELQTKHRGGDADGARKPPKDKHEDKETKVLHDQLDDSFPASDPPASTQPQAKEPPPPKPRQSGEIT
jgi:hypothetical protein